ncbi:MAG TPA: hypothetical protein P5555_05695 [Candidatus Paceibacterota bacterium]|nr:hypothetical protein [Verrucomicrobiota bacterium]HRZ44664.1 hypothetical protein [Candidatus Paceibacterota bacterium]HRZ94104.1 hypothetical protein [Candidatus Paceibacterota bacterium]
MKTVSVRIQRLAALAGLAACAALSANANVFLTENENTFKSYLLPGYYLEDFDGYTDETGDKSFQGTELLLSYGSWGYEITPDPGIGTLYSLNSAMSVSERDDGLKVEFTGASVTAVGGFFYPANYDGGYLSRSIALELNDGTTQTFTFDPTSDPKFRGFRSSDVPISSITIRVVQSGDSAWAAMDHFYVGGAVPEPVGVATMTGVVLLGGAGLMRWRKRL